MRIDLQEIRRLVQKYQPEILEFCQKLVRIHSVNGVDTEGKVAQLIVDQAKNLGLPVEVVGCDSGNLRPRRPGASPIIT